MNPSRGRRPSSVVRGALVSQEKQGFAREQRRQPTASEQLAWGLLRNRRCLGLKFRRQQVIGPFVADFYCAHLRLALELDGGVHDDTDVASYDEARELALNKRKVRVLRIRADDVSAERLRERLAPLVAAAEPERQHPLARGPLADP